MYLAYMYKRYCSTKTDKMFSVINDELLVNFKDLSIKHNIPFLLIKLIRQKYVGFYLYKAICLED